jgi:hypothetical protein
VQHWSGAVRLVADGLRLEPKPSPALCTTAWLGVDSPRMNSEMPTMLSFPAVLSYADMLGEQRIGWTSNCPAAQVQNVPTDHCPGYAGMAEQTMHRPNVTTILPQMRGERMT